MKPITHTTVTVEPKRMWRTILPGKRWGWLAEAKSYNEHGLVLIRSASAKSKQKAIKHAVGAVNEAIAEKDYIQRYYEVIKLDHPLPRETDEPY